jgi:hypothetical protein
MATTQFCLTDPGTNLVGPTVSLLSDNNNFTTPFQTGVSLSSLQPPNCPVTLTVPDTATIVKVFDQETNSCATVNLQGNDLCTLFNLTITELQTQTISQIIIGDFTTSFGPVTDYLIYWYRNDDTEPQYITGKGTLYSGYIASHPLTGSAALLAQSGQYSIKIAKMNINGVDFSTLDTPEPGFVKVITSCIPQVLVTVSALNCSNGNFTSTDYFYSGYSHKFEFNNAAVGVTPQSLSTTFDLDITTNYFAFMFVAQNVFDTLKITFIGGAYEDPIVLEYLELGGDVPTIVSVPNIVPKKFNSTLGFKKILTLTSLNRTIEDYLIIEITPNEINYQTIWSLYLKCLTSINCTHCTDQFINQPYKLNGTPGDTYPTVSTCNSLNVNTQIQACTQDSLYNTDIYKYLSEYTSNWYNMSVGCTSCVPPILRSVAVAGLNANTKTCTQPGVGTNRICGPNPNGNVQISSSVNSGTLTLTITFSDTANFTNFLNNLTTSLTNRRNANPNYLNPLDTDYYQYITFLYPNGQGCGDSISPAAITIPLWATTSSTSNSLNISYSQISSASLQNFKDTNSLTSCDSGCISISDSIANTLNSQINNFNTNPLNYNNNSGGYYTTPFSQYGGLSITGPEVRTQNATSTNIYINVYKNCTYMFSGDPLTLINTTPIKACDFESIGGWPISLNPSYIISANLSNHNRQLYDYKFTPRTPYNPTYPGDFLIEGRVPTNGVLGPYQFAYQRLNGVVTTSSTFII